MTLSPEVRRAGAAKTPSVNGRALARVRNIGIMAHIDAGKTTVTERILFLTGRIHRTAEVHDGGATMDYLEEERARGITITSAATTCSWRDHRITVIDTPGHVDFTIEVARSLRVLDGAMAVFCAVAGVEAQSETVWRQARRHAVPCIALINKMDREGADFAKAIESMDRRLGANPIAIQWPIGQAKEFRGILDLVEGKAIIFDPTEKDPFATREEPVPEELAELFAERREAMLWALADVDEELGETVLNGGSPETKTVREAIRRATLANRATPVVCGSALKNRGIPSALDAIVDYLPAPHDVAIAKGTVPETGEEIERLPSTDEPTCALAFKTLADKNGELTFLRVYSGRLRVGDHLLNPALSRIERVGRLYRMHAASRESVDEAVPGDIVAVVGLKSVRTGDTLCVETSPIVLESLDLPEPVTWMAVGPQRTSDRDRLHEVLAKIGREDPSFQFRTDQATDELVIAGMGELHLEVVVNKIRRDWRVSIDTGKPQVAYKQTLAAPVEIEARHVKQTGGRGQFAVVKMRFEPAPELDGGIEFVNEVVGGVVPREYIPSVEKAFRESCVEGLDLGFPLVNVRATLFDGKHHEVDSSEHAFAAASRMAIRNAVAKVGVRLLEPRMRLEVTVADGDVGPVNGDLNSRRCEIHELADEGGVKVIRGIVPIAEMFRYVDTLRSITSGRGAYSMEPSDYALVPASIAEEVMEARRKERAERRKS